MIHSKKVTADSLLDSLAVLDENILAEAARMARLFARAAQYRVEKMRYRARAEAALEQWAAHLSLLYRSRAKGKPTEAYYKARIILNKRHQRLTVEKEACERREELAKLILDAYRQRRDAIRIIADHKGYDAYSTEKMLERDVQSRRLRKQARHLRNKNGRSND